MCALILRLMYICILYLCVIQNVAIYGHVCQMARHGQNINMYNWAGTFTYGTQNIQWPRSVAQVKQIVKNACKIRCIGQRHSFSRIGDSTGTLLDTIGLKNILSPVENGIDPTDPAVWVQCGLTYIDLAPFLEYFGYALPNLASLADLSIAGAAQTGVHGSGNTLGGLATHIRALRVVRADGTEELIARGDPRLGALAVGLGAFGVVTTLELGLVPTYNLTTNVFLNLPHKQFMHNFDAIMAAGYTVHVFANFQLPGGIWNIVWVAERSDQNNGVGKQQFLLNTTAKRIDQQVAVAGSMPPTYLLKYHTEQPWYHGLVHFQLGVFANADYRNGENGNDSGGDQMQSEYFVAQENATKAIEAVYKYLPKLGALVLIRTVKCDHLWLSPTRCRGPSDQLAVAIHLSLSPDLARINPVLRQVEQALIPFGARPHWGKHFLMEPKEFMNTYDKHAEFVALAKKFDPHGKFRNDFLDKYVFVDK